MGCKILSIDNWQLCSLLKVISIRGLLPIIFKLHSNDFDGEFGACELWLGAAAASDHSSDRKNVRHVRKEWDFFPLHDGAYGHLSSNSLHFMQKVCGKKKSNFDAGNPYPELKQEMNEKINPQSRCTLSLNSQLELECGSISATTINNFPNYSPSGH